MRMFDLSSKLDEMIMPDDTWYYECYRAVACSLCNDVLPPHRDEPLRVVVDEEAVEPKGPVALLWNANVSLLQVELATDLNLSQCGFHCGDVEHRGATWDRYTSIVATTAPRILTRSSATDPITHCEECGRPFTRVMYQNEWILKSDVGARDVYSDMAGGALIVSEGALAAVRPSVRRNLRERVLKVRSM